MIQLANISAEILQSENILEDGSMDPTKNVWSYGGRVYDVEYIEDSKLHSMRVQLEGDLWHYPEYDLSSKGLLELIVKAHTLDKDYAGYCLQKEVEEIRLTEELLDSLLLDSH